MAYLVQIELLCNARECQDYAARNGYRNHPWAIASTKDGMILMWYETREEAAAVVHFNPNL